LGALFGAARHSALHRPLRETRHPPTFFVPGYDAEYYPDTVKEIHRRGFEVAAHGYLHEGWELGDEEEELLTRTHRKG